MLRPWPREQGSGSLGEAAGNTCRTHVPAFAHAAVQLQHVNRLPLSPSPTDPATYDNSRWEVTTMAKKEHEKREIKKDSKRER